MPDMTSDDAFVQVLAQTGMVTNEQIEAARKAQAESARNGINLPIAEILVIQGVVTAAQRQLVAQKAHAQQEGGIRQLGQYRLLRKLGEGGMGTVYLAEDTMMRRKVALKTLSRHCAENSQFVSRFQREARAAGKLNHENIVCAFVVGEDQGEHFYVMEYCEGESLDRRLASEQALTCNEALDLVAQVARGLQYAHERGFVHRDIKPANILVTRDGVAKILDLGLAKNLEDISQSTHTQTGVALGTPLYLSPEQARGEKNIDRRADIYSLGATFYHLITGQPPYAGSTEAVIMTKHLSEPPPDAKAVRPDVPDGVALIIRKMMAKKPAQRYQDCAALLTDLESVKAGRAPGVASPAFVASVSSGAAVPAPRIQQPQQPTPTGEQSVAPPAPASRRIVPVFAAVAAVVVLGLLALIVVVSGTFSSRTDSAAADPARQPKADAPRKPEKTRAAPDPPPSRRNLLVQRHGGSQATESGVDLALCWLAHHQEADGHWDAKKYSAMVQVDTAVTGFALLAFLGAGHTEKVGEYKGNVQRAVAWLKSKQDADGMIWDTSDDNAGHRAKGYPCAIATQSMAEAAGMANIPDTKAAAQKAIDYCTEKHQAGEGTDKGAWRYSPKAAAYLCVTGWFVAALKSAKVAGLRVNPASFDGAIKFLDQVEKKEAGGGYGSASHYEYQPGAPHDSTAHRLTMVGNLARQFMGWKKEDLQASVEWAVNKGGVPTWGANGESVDLYYWYYGTLCVFQQGGDIWERWNEAMKNALVTNQCKQGDDAGSWNPVGDFSQEWGRVGQTALGCLCLEVYYRYIPATAALIGDKPTDEAPQTVYVLKDGRRIRAAKVVDAGDEYAIKDDTGKIQNVKKSDVAEIVKE